MTDKTPLKPAKKPYKDTLDQKTRVRYEEKTACIGVDPYEVAKCSMTNDRSCLPAITYIDIVNYLINTKSAYTMEQLKAVKSLESYNQFINGWVKDVSSMTVNNKVLVTGRVRHSQRMNDTPLKPWVIANPDGIIDSAHCDCMAGLGEVCSHVGALLFYVEQVYKITSAKTVTQEKAYWLLPTSIDKVPYTEVRHIDFTSAVTKKRQMDSEICCTPVPKRSLAKMPMIPEPSTEEISAFNDKLFHSNTRPSILAVTEAYQDHYIPEVLKDGYLPMALLHLRDEKYAVMDGSELRKECEQLFSTISVTEVQAKNVEYVTKLQSMCKEWHALRTGRITASVMKAVCQTTVEKPAISTVNLICGNSRFSNKATQWGCRHESIALTAYSKEMKKEHVNVFVGKSGLAINPKYPHMGASPDAIVSCECCGEGVVEVKCPYCVKDKVLSEVEDRVEFLEAGKLKKNHKYAFQIQTQLLVTERDFCDFVVWTEQDLTIERIEPDMQMQDIIMTKSQLFFVKVILPELTGNLITRETVARGTRPSHSSQLNTDQSDEIVCVCQQAYDKNGDDVIGCDNENCRYKWLHFNCIGLKKIPKGLYFCPDCVKQKKKSKTR